LPEELRHDLWESFRRESVRSFVARMCAGYQGTLPRLPEIAPESPAELCCFGARTTAIFHLRTQSSFSV